MGFRQGEGRPTGLSGLASLLDSPRDSRRGVHVTAVDASRLASDLQSAVAYVVGGSSGTGGSRREQAVLVHEGHIDYAAVAEHVQQVVQAGCSRALEAEQQQDSTAATVADEQPLGAAQQAAWQRQDAPHSSSGASGSSSQGASSTSAAGGGSGDRPSTSGSAGPEAEDQAPPLEPESPHSPAVATAALGAVPCADTPSAAAVAASSAGGGSGSTGRLGPAEVSLVEARGSCDIQGGCAMSRTNFATVRSNACVFRGRWQYEVQLGSAGIMQLGWTTLNARFNSEEGVGDNHDSYAYDGRRCMRWHASNNAYGERWAPGDVIGCCLDLDAGSMRFYRNGKDLGEAFVNVRRSMPGAAYFAGVSMSYAERCEVNFGGRPFVHPAEGYHPMQQQIPDKDQPPAGSGCDVPRTRQGQLAAARYLAGCLSRLVDVSSPAPAHSAAGTAGTAAGGAAGAAGGGVDADAEATEQLTANAAAAEETAAQAAAAVGSAAAVLPGNAGLPLPLAADLIASNGKAVAAQAAAAPLLPGGLRGGNWGGSGSTPVCPALNIDDRVLLGAVLAQHLGPLCFDPYAVEAVLLPMLDDTAGELGSGSIHSSSGSKRAEGGETGERTNDGACPRPCPAGGAPGRGKDPGSKPGSRPGSAAAYAAGSGAGSSEDDGGSGGCQELGRQRLAQLLELLGAVLEPEEVAALAASSCQVLARRVRGCLWGLRELPGSTALSALRLWSAVLDCDTFRDAWLTTPDWQQQMEQLLAVRQPSENDLGEIFKRLKVVWSEGGVGVVRNHRDDRSAFAEDLARICDGIEQVEAAQSDLLLQLWLAHDMTSATTSSSSSSSGRANADAALQYPQPTGVGGEASGSGDVAGQQHAAEQGGREPGQGEESREGQGREAQEPGVDREQVATAGALQELSDREPDQGTEAVQAQARAHAPLEVQQAPPADPARPCSARPSEASPLHQFLQYLIDKNHGATRQVPPPGLSDQTSLVSVVFALLRLMNEQVSASLPVVPTLRWDPTITFLQGGPLGGGDDPYYDQGRLGGTLSHLAREHPPTDQDRRPLDGLPLGAVVTFSAPLRLASHVARGPSFSEVWLQDRLLMLCHLSAAPMMRGALSHLASMQAAMAGLRAVSSEGVSGRMADETRRQCQQEFVRSLRSHEWAQCWLLSSWRQQAAFVLAVGTSQLLDAVSEQRGGLLRYVPEFYISTCLDLVHAVHRCEPAVLDHAAMLGLGLRHVVKFVVSHLEDERVVSPEAQSRLLHWVLDGVQELELLKELGSNPVSRARLLPAIMRLFCRPQLWGPASSFFGLLVEGSGFLHPPPAYPAEFSQPLGTLRELFKTACLADADLCARFTHHLFDNANRMLTELVALLEGMESGWARGTGPSTQMLRLLSSTADYALVLLRVVELMAVEMPELFLEGSEMSLTRLAEVLGFALPQFVSGRAHSALQRVAADRVARQVRLREAHLLQPLAGALVALWQAEQAAAEQAAAEQAAAEQQQAADTQQRQGEQQVAAEQQQAEAGRAALIGPGCELEAATLPKQQQQQQQQQQPRPRQHLLARTLGRQAALTDRVLRGLMDMEPSEVEPLSAEAAAADSEEGEQPPGQQQAQREAQLEQLRSTIEGLLGQRLAAAEAAAGKGRGGGEKEDGTGGGAELAEVPEDFLDPILMMLMTDPVLLPNSRVCVDRSTIERHLLSSATDPFSRAPLAKEQLVPHTELRQQIEAWVELHGHTS